jgi:hypothetical protein
MLDFLYFNFSFICENYSTGSPVVDTINCYIVFREQSTSAVLNKRVHASNNFQQYASATDRTVSGFQSSRGQHKQKKYPTPMLIIEN